MGAAMRPSGQITSNLLLTGQTGQTKLTSKLDFPGNLQLAAFTILAMFLNQYLFRPQDRDRPQKRQSERLEFTI